MSEAFLKVVNMSISAGWLVLAVLALRLILKKAPKWVNVLLWGIVAIRLICPFSIESALSLIPSRETISPEIMMDWTPEISTGIAPLDQVVNPVISTSFAPEPSASANPLQILIPVAANLWLLGVIIMLAYTTISYLTLRRKLITAVILRGNIFQCETVSSPFVLGILKPRIYLPYAMDGKNLDHVVAHERAHIQRKDHWWKPLGFLLLTVYWFNPLMWVAYIILCRDIELACDEKVIAELGNEQRADYTQALVACAVNRRMIAACPLAFGEVGVKERVKSVMNYKKPAFWVVVASVIFCAVVAICFLTNPAAEREFPIDGSNVSTLDTERVVEMIAKAEKLDDGSQLCVNEDAFDLMFTSDFEWANDGAIRFFYLKDQKTYSAQLRMFHDDNKYFITDSIEWIEQAQFFKLFHYLDALKYMPQEEIRKLSPDADGFSVYMRNDGAPGDYNRVLKYSQNGVEDIDGWYIHLEVQPLHEVEGGAYYGSGDELIHLFYGHQDLVMLENNTVRKWFDYTEDPSEMSYEEELKIQLDEFPDIIFKYTPYDIVATTSWEDSDLVGRTILISGLPIWNAYFCDLTGDGLPEICSQVSYGSGMIDNRVIIIDYANGINYKLEDRGYHDYYLRMNDADGYLYVDKKVYNSDESVSSGKLVFKDGCIQIEGVTSEPMEIPAPEQVFEGSLNLGLNAVIVEIDSDNQILYVKDIDESADVFGERCAIDCSYAISRNNLLYVNYGDPNDVRTIEFDDFEVGDSIIIGMYDSEKEKAFNGSAIAEQVQLSTQRLSSETEFSVNFAGNTSLHQQFILTEDRPYWCILVENQGSKNIVTEIGGDVYEVEPGTFDKVYSDEKWKPGAYSVSFATSGASGMTGNAVCYTYKYRIEITGRLHNAVKDTTYILLTNIEGITFEQAWKASGLSSNMDDYFDPADAVFIGIR